MGDLSFCRKLRFASQVAISVLPLVITNVGVAASNKADAPVSTGISLSVDSPTVPPGGLLQMRVFVTEPNPILKGKQGVKFAAVRAAALATPLTTAVIPAPLLGPIRDAALFSAAGDVSGVAVGKSGGTRVFFTSPLTSFGTTPDTPVMTIQVPVSSAAATGQTDDLTLDPNNSLWYDPNSNLYPVELKSGVMTVGGTLSVSDVTPGAGIVQPGKVISIKGIGFDSSSKVDIAEAAIATTSFINANLIQVTLSAALDIRGRRIRVTNANKELVMYYPYQRTTRQGVSTHTLIASSIPLFAETTWKIGFFRPTLTGTIFSGLALQNLNTVKANVVLRLTRNGAVVATQSIVLGVKSSMARDLAELLPGAVANAGTRLRVSSDQPIQMMGLLADESTRTVLPINPTSTP
jgi:hypothetical protein